MQKQYYHRHCGPRKRATFIIFNISVKHWSISIIFGMQH